MRDNKRYAAVWEVLQALRAHDERFNAMVNRIELIKRRDDKINVIGVPGPDGRATTAATPPALRALADLPDEWRARSTRKSSRRSVPRRYWEDWAGDIHRHRPAHTSPASPPLDGGNPRSPGV